MHGDLPWIAMPAAWCHSILCARTSTSTGGMIDYRLMSNRVYPVVTPHNVVGVGAEPGELEPMGAPGCRRNFLATRRLGNHPQRLHKWHRGLHVLVRSERHFSLQRRLSASVDTSMPPWYRKG